MPVDRHPVSVSQFCELLAIDPARFVAVEFNRQRRSLALVLEPEDTMQTKGTFPALSTGKKIGGGKKGGGKRGC